MPVGVSQGYRSPMAPVRHPGRWALGVVRRHPFRFDVAFAILLMIGSAVGYSTANPVGSERDADAFGLLLVVVNSGVLAWRRRAPLITLAIATVSMIAFWILDYPTDFDPAMVFAMYAAAAHGKDRRRTAQAVGASLVVITMVAIIGVIVSEEALTLGEAVGVFIIFGTAAAVGEIVYGRGQRLLDLEARAARAEADREANARQAVLDERTRIAREMHDVVAHGMSVMVVQAGAARRVLVADPDRAVEAMATIEATGREALAEMRRLLGVLRDSVDERAELVPQPTLADLDSLIATCREAGLSVTLDIQGERPDLGPGRDLAVYRVVQEALTNVIRHAGPARCEVTLRFEPDHLVVDVIDDGLGAASAIAGGSPAGGGHGLVGMRERVELYRGRLTVGPRPGGGFGVHAALPYSGAHLPAPAGAGTSVR